MPTESWYKTSLVKKLRDAGAYARRVEDQFAVGILDMIIIIPDMPVLFAEGKVMTGNVLAPTERQFIEGHRILDAGMGRALPVLIGWKDGKMCVADWGKARFLLECVFEEPGDTPLDIIDRWWTRWQTTVQLHPVYSQRHQELSRKIAAINTDQPKIPLK